MFVIDMLNTTHPGIFCVDVEAGIEAKSQNVTYDFDICRRGSVCEQALLITRLSTGKTHIRPFQREKLSPTNVREAVVDVRQQMSKFIHSRRPK